MKSHNLHDILITLILLANLLFLGACQPISPTPTVTATEADPEPTEPTLEIPEEPPAPTETPTDEPEPTPTETPEVTEEVTEAPGLPSPPVPQSIQTADGETLEGTFYPAAVPGAPLIILMHWAMGDQTDWRAIAPWLQNRGEGQDIYDGPANWQDPTWFPAIPEENSYNVFTFTFRGCQGGCQDFNREGWLLDVEAAMTHAATLEGVDPARVMALGASIGADGAAYGCHYYNQEQGGGCLGAMSLSPGGYLTIPYPEEVEALSNETPPTPAWCLYADGDGTAAAACQGAEGALYRAVQYEDAAHGMALITKERAPNPLDLILEFINQFLQPAS